MTTLVANPREAARALGGSGVQMVPKQRHLFLVRFYMHGAQTGASPDLLDSLSFVAKSVERPKVNPKTEELHQYNKKRHVYTGFKLEPLRMQIYDDYQSNALTMWKSYTNYYFGDFQPAAAGDYQYDVTSQTFQNSGQGFGFIAPSADPSADWFFDRIEIYHFYHSLYDVYQLIHPRITGLDPDDLDYENAAISLISLSVAYENLQFEVQVATDSGDANGQPFPEFVAGGIFNGAVPYVASSNTTPNDAAASVNPQSSAASVDTLLNTAQGALTNPSDYRYTSANSGGALGLFGNFQFGPTAPSSLSEQALTNPALAAALNRGSAIDPLTVANNSVQAIDSALSQGGINGAAYDVALSQSLAATSQYGGATSRLTGAILASAAINGQRSIATPSGVALSPEGYGTINARQSGTAQYGLNTSPPPEAGVVYGLGSGVFADLGII